MSPPAANAPQNQTRKDFISDQDVRWCPGCGDYAILAQLQNVLPKLNIPKENYVFVSGIGCSSRFPYYMNTYGFHTIHGRAPAIATGLKSHRPDLSVWGVTGDGDGPRMGAKHLSHRYPPQPLTLALGVEASFVARTVDTDVKHMGEILEAAGRHRGTAFVEIYQNCVIFNENALCELP